MRKHFWQIIGTLVAIVAIVATYDVFFRSKAIKEVKVVTSLPLSLVDINPDAAKDIEVRYKGKPVSNISLLQLQITNTGNQPILESDYTKPLSFSFTPNNEILDAAIISSNPPNIGMEISQQSQNSVEMSKTLLNPQDSISIKFVIKGSVGDALLREFNAAGRIVGVKDISVLSSSDQDKQSSWYAFLFGLFTPIAISIIGVFIAWIFGKRKAAVE